MFLEDYGPFFYFHPTSVICLALSLKLLPNNPLFYHWSCWCCS